MRPERHPTEERARPRVSVLLVTYNLERFVEDALDSLALQTFTDYEIVAADDGSTDNTLSILERRAGQLPIRVVSGPNVGVAANRARGLDRCRGEFIALLDGDDRLLPDHLAAAVATLDAAPGAALSYCDKILIDESGAKVRMFLPDGDEGLVDPVELLRSNYIGCSGVVIRRDALAAVGGIDPEMALENELWFRVTRAFPISYIPTPTIEYRVRGDGLYSDAQTNLTWRLAMYEKHAEALGSARRRELIAEAHIKTAYRQLWPKPTSETVALARRNIERAFLVRRRSVIGRRVVAMAISALFGKLYVRAVNRYGDAVSGHGLKPRLQRLLGFGR